MVGLPQHRGKFVHLLSHTGLQYRTRCAGLCKMATEPFLGSDYV